MTKGLPLFSFLDKRKLVEAPLTKGAMLNNKGKNRALAPPQRPGKKNSGKKEWKEKIKT